MALREILKIPDKRLRLVSAPLKRVDAEIRALAEDMFETMYDAPGIGLAAIQVGVPTRLVVMDLSKKDDAHAPQVFINPEITWASDEKSTHEEGCLSIPEYYEEVERPLLVKVRYLDLDGKSHEIEADGLFATCLQHEIDHTNGMLFIDHISRLKRARVIKKFTKAAKIATRPRIRRRTRQRRTWRRDWRCASSSWGRRTSRCPRSLSLSAAGTMSWRSIPARRSRPAAEWNCEKARSHAKPRGSGFRSSRRRHCVTAEAAAAIRAHGADAAVVIAYGLILPQPILDAFPLGCFNLHASLLPRWRGAAPIQRAIMAGDRETGVMVMRMEAGLDTGPIAMAERVAIGADATAGELHDELARRGAKLMVIALAALERGTLQLTPQPADGVTYATKIEKAETRIDWTKPWQQVHDHCRGLSPFPGAWFEMAGHRAGQGSAFNQRNRQRQARPGARRAIDRRLRRRRRAPRRIAARRPATDAHGGIPARHADRARLRPRLSDAPLQAHHRI